MKRYLTIVMIIITINSFSQITKNVIGFNQYVWPNVNELYDGLTLDSVICKELYSPNLKSFKYLVHGSYLTFHYFKEKGKEMNESNRALFLKDSGRCNYGVRFDYWVEYYPPKFVHNTVYKGKIKEAGNYYYGQKVGDWRYYNIEGKMKIKKHDLKLDYMDVFSYPYITKYIQLDTIIVRYKLIKDNGYKLEDYSVIKGVGYGYDEYSLIEAAYRNIIFMTANLNKDIIDTIRITVLENTSKKGNAKMCGINIESNLDRKLRINKVK